MSNSGFPVLVMHPVKSADILRTIEKERIKEAQMNNMENVKYITVNGLDFIIVKELEYNGQHYMLAIDEEKENTIAVLRQVFVDGEELVESVTEEEELKAVLEKLLSNEENLTVLN